MSERVRYAVVAHEPRVIVGLFLQPFVSFLLGLAVFPVVDYSGRLLDGSRAIDMLDGAIAFGLATGITGFLVTIFGVCPALVWLLARGTVTRKHVLSGGVVLGSTPGLVALAAWLATSLFAPSESAPLSGAAVDVNALSYGVTVVARGIALGSLIGFGCAAVFWFVARSRIDSDPSWRR